jgi:hypothetical protein
VGRSAWSVALAVRDSRDAEYVDVTSRTPPPTTAAGARLVVSVVVPARRKGATTAVLPSATCEWGVAAGPVQGDDRRVLLVRSRLDELGEAPWRSLQAEGWVTVWVTTGPVLL